MQTLQEIKDYAFTILREERIQKALIYWRQYELNLSKKNSTVISCNE
jgi:hypothetical protein